MSTSKRMSSSPPTPTCTWAEGSFLLCRLQIQRQRSPRGERGGRWRTRSRIASRGYTTEDHNHQVYIISDVDGGGGKTSMFGHNLIATMICVEDIGGD